MICKTEKSRINKSKIWLFEKYNKIHKPLANLRFKNGENANTQKQKLNGGIA